MDTNTPTRTTYVMRSEGGRWAIYENRRDGERCLADMSFTTATKILRLCAVEGWTPSQADEIVSLDFHDSFGCECEIDWSCPLHYGQLTWIETRHQGLDEDEARAFGRFA